MSKTLSQIGELGLIHSLKKQIGVSHPVIRGIGDDTAVVPLSSKKYLLLTTDMLVEGVHFTKRMRAHAVGHKAIAASISDIAAMGGKPQYAVISLGAPSTRSRQYISSMYRGIQATAKKFGVRIIGGDTVRNTKLIINVAMIGEVSKRNVVYRHGARKGDQIFVTGPLGRSYASGWHLKFVPRVAQAQHLLKIGKPTAMIDISDGLAADLDHILNESRVGAVIDESLIPFRKGAGIKNALGDGEDFELLFTCSPPKARSLHKYSKRFGFTRIGEIVERKRGFQLKTIKKQMKKVSSTGYTHF